MINTGRLQARRTKVRALLAHRFALWVGQARRDAIVTRAEENVIAENARLRRENQELRDTNELVRAA